ncbi:hypothetical protein [Sebaldella sp. S0638]|uniref:hypothetical protein n=1 Tax=Sebaldella sp. S0638 TaxID=2957809 RepID=UPI00209D44D0|nr:hypothetical protein [Sebaldella sp. S0638]MCP1223428.1 hypothetical protein [Sebaldella sp. S0638]
MFKKISGKDTSLDESAEINEKLKELAEENNERLFEDSEGLYERIQNDLDYMLAKEIGADEYGELDSMIQILIPEGYKIYEKIKEEFFSNKKEAMEKVLGITDVENMTFTEFIYFYLQKNTDSYYYENLATGYVKGFKKLLDDEGINLENINWESLEGKEESYEELLIDIVLSLINKALKNEKKTLFGIDIGMGSKIFFLRDTEDYKKIKEIETDFYYVYDIEYVKGFYTSIYEIIVAPFKELEVSKGDFVELAEGETGIVKVKTLFKAENKEYDINKNILKQVF